MRILHTCSLQKHELNCDGETLLKVHPGASVAEALKQMYTDLGIDYRKFYKMDLYSKTAIVLDHILPKPGLKEHSPGSIGIFLTNYTGCTNSDALFYSSNEEEGFNPSPAKFVYTLPNIMIGELCIRHGIQGDNTYFSSLIYSEEKIRDTVELLALGSNLKLCICGWIDPFADESLWGKLFWAEL